MKAFESGLVDWKIINSDQLHGKKMVLQRYTLSKVKVYLRLQMSNMDSSKRHFGYTEL